MFLPTLNGPALRIAIIRSSSIGDVVLATSCLDLLSRLRYPVEVTWVGKNPSLDLLRSVFPRMKVLPIDYSGDSKSDTLAQRLSNAHVVVDLQASLRSRMLTQSLKSQYGTPVFSCPKAYIQRTKFIAESRILGRSRILPDEVLHPQKLQHQTMYETLLKALKHQLPSEYMDHIVDYSAKPVFPIESTSDQSPWIKELSFGKWLTVAPGASYEAKRAPVPKFGEILKTLKKSLEDEKLGLLLVGSEADRKHAVELVKIVDWEGPILNLAGKLSLFESSKAIQKSCSFLGNDSGLGHVAEAVGVPVSLMFGPTVEGFGFAPHLKESETYSSNLGCRPCSKHGKSKCRFDDKLCLDGIEVKQIVDNILGHVFNSESNFLPNGVEDGPEGPVKTRSNDLFDHY